MSAAYVQVQTVGGAAIWAVGEASAASAPPGAVTAVAGAATGGTTASIVWTRADSTESGFRVQVEVPAGSGNWVAASGATNPTAAGVQTFSATGLPGATAIRPRVQAFNGSGDAAWTLGNPFTTDNVATGGGTIPAGATAPTVLIQPSAVTVAVGLQVTLQAGFSGLPEPTLQWRRGGVPIFGATAASYSFTAQQQDSGALFDCVATNSAGSATTIPVAVFVTLAAPTPVLLEAFSPFVLPFAPHCPWLVAELSVRQACIEWFQRTLCWRFAVTAISEDGRVNYPIPMLTDAVLAKMTSTVATAGGCKYRVLPLDAGGPSTREDAEGLWTDDRKTFNIMPPLGVAGATIEFQVALKPSQTCTGIPEVHFEQYADHIAQGALARILAMKDKKWTDLRGAADAKAAFENAIAKVASLVARGHARGAFRTQSHWF